MPYDPKLDESVFARAWEGDNNQRITVSVYSYNQGEKKLQISRETKNIQGEYKFGKLGRMTKEEIQAILPLIEEASQNMD